MYCGFKNTNRLDFTIQLQQPNICGEELKFTASTKHIMNVCLCVSKIYSSVFISL